MKNRWFTLSLWGYYWLYPLKGFWSLTPHYNFRSRSRAAVYFCSLCLVTRKRIHILFHCILVFCIIFFRLISYIFCNHLFISTDCIYIASSAPKTYSVPILLILCVRACIRLAGLGFANTLFHPRQNRGFVYTCKYTKKATANHKKCSCFDFNFSVLLMPF